MRRAPDDLPRSNQGVLAGERFDLAHFGELVGDPSRAAMLLALMDGRQRPASELATLAGVSASTASVHLRRLVDGGLLASHALGRHRYFRLASDEVAHALEVIALRHPARPRRSEPSPARRALEHARTCYRHLAGELGVRWFRALEDQRLLDWTDGAMRMNARGVARLAALGMSPERWPVGKPCLDWTERRNHLGGPLGVVLTEQLLALRWFARAPEGRALRITASGARGLERAFGIRI